MKVIQYIDAETGEVVHTVEVKDGVSPDKVEAGMLRNMHERYITRRVEAAE